MYIDLDCVGLHSGQAGRVAACAGCPNQANCATGRNRGVDPGI